MFHKNIKRASKWLHKNLSNKAIHGAASFLHKRLDNVKASYNKLKQGLQDTDTGKLLVDAVESNPLALGVKALYAGAHDISKGVSDGTASRPTRAVDAFIEG